MSRQSSHFPLGLLLLFGLLVMLACDWSIDSGINCLQAADSKLIALSYEEYNGIPNNPSGFNSVDGGLTWQPSWQNDPARPFELKCKHTMPVQLSNPRDLRVQYRFSPEGGVERSEDGGQTWQHELDAALGEAEAVYYSKSRGPMETNARSKPQDAIIDEQTGNVVVALGLAGVAVRTADGHWQHVSVGPYTYQPLDTGKIAALLKGESLLAIAGLFLIIETSFLFATGWRWWSIVFVGLLWIWWLFLLFLATANNTFFFPLSGPGSMLDELFYLLVLFALPWGGHAFYRLSRITWRAVFIAGLGGLMGGFLFYAMYWLWAWVKIPAYRTATFYALLLVIAVIIATAYFIHREIERVTVDRLQSEPRSEVDDIASWS
jgi:hypothetical protein